MFRGILLRTQQHKSGLRSQFCLLAFVLGSIPAWGQPPSPLRGYGAQGPPLAGQVVDARTGAALEKVLVMVEDAGKSVLTDAEGRFRIDGLPPGPHRLYVSVVGYSLFRREVTVGPGAPPLTVRLSEGTTAYSETVTVTPDVFRAPADPVPSSHVLGSAELLN